MNGDRTVRTMIADKREIARRCQAAGLTDLQAADRTGLPADTIMRHRQELGLPPNGNGSHAQPDVRLLEEAASR